MTHTEIADFFGGALPTGTVADLYAAANADPEESGDWLPYYKMALNRLVQCCGLLRGLLSATQTDRLQRQEEVITEAGELFYQHLLCCGIGPRRDPHIMATCRRDAGIATDQFINDPAPLS